MINKINNIYYNYKMKFISLVSLLFTASLLEEQQCYQIKKASAEESQAAEADLDALMNKYDDQEKSDKDAKKNKKKENKAADPNQPSASMIQDYELKILSGNNMAESSAKSGEDDVINEVLDKYTKKGKDGNEIISKDDAQDACNDIYEKLRGVDSYTAIDQVKEKFTKSWNEHDVNNQTFLERSEAYSLVQDVTRM